MTTAARRSPTLPPPRSFPGEGGSLGAQPRLVWGALGAVAVPVGRRPAMATGDLEAGLGGGRRGVVTPLRRLVPAVVVKGAAPRPPAAGGCDGRDVDNGADDFVSADGSHPVAMSPDHPRALPSVLSVMQAAAGEFFGVFLVLFFTTSAVVAKTTGSPLASLVDVTLMAWPWPSPARGGISTPRCRLPFRSFGAAACRCGSSPFLWLPRWRARRRARR